MLPPLLLPFTAAVIGVCRAYVTRMPNLLLLPIMEDPETVAQPSNMYKTYLC